MVITNSFCNNLNSREQACFNAVSKWRRAELKNKWLNALVPCFLKLENKPSHIVLFEVVFSPLLFVVYIAKFIWETISLPFSMIETYFSPVNINGTGERSIQGIHHRLVPYISLSPQYYIYCVNEWVEILYGEPQALRCSLKEFIDPAMVENIQSLYGDDLNSHTRHILASAREKLSRRLGNY